ncbi:uncharacterized protein N7459_004895 [Penicillium hispanicum]|uniref:uncharacterized protein n=1 Tax=Penicillium hispanicum TaxID=1080232 RepID=UPI0025410603|nr:uncharacterized protein N7459_004895 [Penicillium hispanicum]KAJ5585095.1 hypothetical protein N7459_004895 [Penicillium hispanicum]
MAMKYLLADQSLLKVEHFEGIPWLLAQYMWEALKEPHKQTMHLWMIMTLVYRSQFFQISPSYHLRVDVPREPLADYFNTLNSESLDWLAVLTVSSNYGTVTDMVSIGNIKNLVALEINGTKRAKWAPGGRTDESIWQSGLDYRIFRSWAEMAQSGHFLQHLRILKLCKQNRLDPSILRLLVELPQLQVVVAHCCDIFTEEGHKSRLYLSREGLPLQGWIAWTPQSMAAAGKGHGSWGPDGNVRKLYRDTLAKEGTNSGDISPHVPIMELELAPSQPVGSDGVASGAPRLIGADTSRARVMVAGPGTNDTIIFTRPTEPVGGTKRAAPTSSRSQPVRVMKKRSRDVADMLGEFM